MGFLDEFATAISSYPDEYVTLEIVDLNVPEDVLNVGEEGTFRVYVHNSGPLQMNDVTVTLTGKRGTLVKPDTSALGDFYPDADSRVGQFPDILGHNTGMPVDEQKTLQAFMFKAPPDAKGEGDLVEVSLRGWNGQLNHMLDGHSRPAPAVKAVYRDRVRGD
jgi:uncharacterized repeat protein (TIGR01451 family)